MGNESKQNRRLTSGLVALSSVAVLSVYTAGFFKTRPAAQELEGEGARRRLAAPVAVVAPASSPASAGRLIGPSPAPQESAAATPPPRVAAPRAASTEPTIAAMPAAATPAPRAASLPATLQAAPVVQPIAPAAAGPVVSPAAPALEPLAPIAPAVEPTAPAAPAPTAPPPLQITEGAPQPGDAVPIRYKDGKYYGWGSCRHGRIEARVIIEGGRITSSAITKCLTRYSCSWITSIVPQVVERQSPEVDYVTGATESADAFYYAIVEALNQAK